MKRGVKLAGVLLAAPVAGMVIALAPMAQASPNDEPCQGASGCHHGVAGSVAWSWKEAAMSTTVYYHNRDEKNSHTLVVDWVIDNACHTPSTEVKVGPDQKGHVKDSCWVRDIHQKD